MSSRSHLHSPSSSGLLKASQSPGTQDRRRHRVGPTLGDRGDGPARCLPLSAAAAAVFLLAVTATDAAAATAAAAAAAFAVCAAECLLSVAAVSPSSSSPPPPPPPCVYPPQQLPLSVCGLSPPPPSICLLYYGTSRCCSRCRRVSVTCICPCPRRSCVSVESFRESFLESFLEAPIIPITCLIIPNYSL